MTSPRSSPVDRAGLFVLLAALAAAVLVAFLAIRNQTEQRAAELVEEGTRLVKALTAIPLDGLTPAPGRPNPLSAVLRAHGNADLAYGLVTDPQGHPLSEVAAPGLSPDESPLSADNPADWFGHRRINSGVAGLDLLEFHGPLLRDGLLQGFVRVGFRAPTLGFDSRQLPFVAGLALPVLLLVPLFFFMLQRQLRPLQAMSQRVEQIASEGGLAGDASARDLVSRFGRFLDVTEQRIRELEAGRGDAETAIKLIGYKREKVESALETLPEGVLVLDEGNLVVFANTKAGPLLSAAPADLLGKQPAQWPVAPTILQTLAPLLAADAASHDADFQPDGNPDRRVSVWALPLFAPRDVSRRLGTLVVLRETTEQMLAARARDEFIAHVAHELKTPLANISLYGELLRDEPALPADTRVEAINTVCDEAERARSLIGNLLNISRIEAGSIVVDRQRVRLAELLADCLEQIRHSGIARGLDLQLEVSADLPPVELDKDLLRIAVNNLLTNAAKYNRPGGRIVLSAEESDERIVIGVQDSGIGIPTADLPHIFDKFYRSTDQEAAARGGHGLGLYLARQIVELHQGQLDVTSQPGQGTRFTLGFRKPHILLRAA